MERTSKLAAPQWAALSADALRRLLAALVTRVLAAAFVAIILPSLAAAQAPPDSAFSLCGVRLGMTDAELRGLVDRSAWDYLDTAGMDRVFAIPDAVVYLVAAAGDDPVLCVAPRPLDADTCFRFAEVNVTRCGSRTVYLTWSMDGFRPNDVDRLRAFVAAILDVLGPRFGRPLGGGIAPANISWKALGRAADRRFSYSTIAKWEWREGAGRKSRAVRYVWVATEKKGDAFRLFVVMADRTADVCQ